MKKLILLTGLFFIFNSTYSQIFYTKELKSDSLTGLNEDTLHLKSNILFKAGKDINMASDGLIDGINISDSINQNLSTGSSPTFDATNIVFSPSRVSELFADFKQDNITKTGWDEVVSGTGADFDASINGLDANHDGIFEFKTGTTASGIAVVTMGNDQTGFLLGGGVRFFEILIQLIDLSTGSDSFILRLGFGDEVDGSEHEDAIWFEYNSSVSVNWLLKTANAASRTTDTTTIAVVEDSWIKLRGESNADATSIEYFINGTSAGTITTDIPTTLMSESMGIVKTAGTVNRRVLVDYYHQRVIYTTPR